MKLSKYNYDYILAISAKNAEVLTMLKYSSECIYFQYTELLENNNKGMKTGYKKYQPMALLFLIFETFLVIFYKVGGYSDRNLIKLRETCNY